MDSQYILLWFEAPMQSWGADSKFGRRDSLPFPTKSGVLGLLCSALGASGEQREFLAEMAQKKQTVISFNQKNEKTLLKKEREPLMRDFHMVGSGYNASDPWESLFIPKTADGKSAVGGGTKMTFRYYLQNAKFAVAIEVPKELVDSFSKALQNPIYDLFLGRKNCVPTDIIFRGIFNTEDEALSTAGQIANQKELLEDFRVLSGKHDGEIMTVNDVPIQFGLIKKYTDRIITIVYHE